MYEVEQMPVSEYLGWIAYFDEKAAAAENKDNLLAGSQENLIQGLTGGS